MKKITNYTKATRRIESILLQGVIVGPCDAPILRDSMTVGHYSTAVPTQQNYAIFGKRILHDTYRTAIDAARGFVDVVGTTRAIDAARKLAKKYNIPLPV